MDGAPGRVPCVWVVASHRELSNEHGAPQCYTVMDEVGTRTLVNLGLQPVCMPRVPPQRVDRMLDMVDGILMGGSATNVHPSLYGEEPLQDDLDFDRCRDAVVQALVPRALERRVPLIGFCRGSHDFNVACGGSLHQSLQALHGPVQHWEELDESLDEQYAERHAVTAVAGGALQRLAGMQRFRVSSLHSQGVKVLGRGLVAEAHADDGLVEAFRWHDASLFAWGFQFHPEWNWRRHPAYERIMHAFAQACWARLERKDVGSSPAAASPAGKLRLDRAAG